MGKKVTVICESCFQNEDTEARAKRLLDLFTKVINQHEEVRNITEESAFA